MTAPFSDRLLDWYDRHARRLPWRTPPGAATPAEPYHVWLSEIMLQQTTVSAVEGYFSRFIALWPDFAALAAAPRDDVMAAWAGLGYYSRARNLKKCAEEVAGRLGGRLPDSEDALGALPGIGPYTAAAIAAIAFGRRAVVVDGNVERVVARFFAIETPLPAARAEIRRAADGLTPQNRCGDFAQAMMDLGATLCTPRTPACAICPVGLDCRGSKLGIAPELPKKAPKAERLLRRASAIVYLRPDGAVLLRRRPDRGMLGGMAEVPTTPWLDARGKKPAIAAAALPDLPSRQTERTVGTVGHTFTHFHLELAVCLREVPAGVAAPDGHWWSGPNAVTGEALPTLMRKVLELAIKHRTEKCAAVFG